MRSQQWITTETILAFFAGDSERARGAYRRELEEAAAGTGISFSENHSWIKIFAQSQREDI
jgi:hypothetical protein